MNRIRRNWKIEGYRNRLAGKYCKQNREMFIMGWVSFLFLIVPLCIIMVAILLGVGIKPFLTILLIAFCVGYGASLYWVRIIGLRIHHRVDRYKAHLDRSIANE